MPMRTVLEPLPPKSNIYFFGFSIRELLPQTVARDRALTLASAVGLRLRTLIRTAGFSQKWSNFETPFSDSLILFIFSPREFIVARSRRAAAVLLGLPTRAQPLLLPVQSSKSQLPYQPTGLFINADQSD